MTVYNDRVIGSETGRETGIPSEYAACIAKVVYATRGSAV
jgi:hypothetical protein